MIVNLNDEIGRCLYRKRGRGRGEGRREHTLNHWRVCFNYPNELLDLPMRHSEDALQCLFFEENKPMQES